MIASGHAGRTHRGRGTQQHYVVVGRVLLVMVSASGEDGSQATAAQPSTGGRCSPALSTLSGCAAKLAKEGTRRAQPSAAKNNYTQSHVHSLAFAVTGERSSVIFTWCLFRGMSPRWKFSIRVRTRTAHTCTEAIMCIGRRSQCKGRRNQPRDRRGKQYSYTTHMENSSGRSMTEVAIYI